VISLPASHLDERTASQLRVLVVFRTASKPFQLRLSSVNHVAECGEPLLSELVRVDDLAVNHEMILSDDAAISLNLKPGGTVFNERGWISINLGIRFYGG